MANNTLNTLLKTYEQKKYKAELKFENDKAEFLKSNPKLADINLKLGTLALDISKAVLNNDSDLENKLRSKFDSLKKEKDNLLKTIKMPRRSNRTNI